MNSSSYSEKTMVLPSSKRTQFLDTYYRQTFSLPKTIMSYVAKNPTTSESYQKIITTCKYFFFQNPIIVLPDAYYDGFEWRKTVSNEIKPCNDLEKVLSKFWITKSFVIRPKNDNVSNIISFIVPKIFRIGVAKVIIKYQVIPHSDYVFLVSSAEKVYLFTVTVKDENGSVVLLEKLVEAASKAKSFYCHSCTPLSNITPETFNELLQLSQFLQLNDFALVNIPETFCIETFYTYMKNNKHTYFRLEFSDIISQPYMKRIEEIVDEILVTKNREYRIPFIDSPASDPRPFWKIQELYSRQ